jgi:hypothetical protein
MVSSSMYPGLLPQQSWTRLTMSFSPTWWSNWDRVCTTCALAAVRMVPASSLATCFHAHLENTAHFLITPFRTCATDNPKTVETVAIEILKVRRVHT